MPEIVKRDREEEPIVFNVEEMGASGKAKVRHVGGWVVKILQKTRKNVRRNLFTANSVTLASVKTQSRLCEIIEEEIIQPNDKLEESSKFPESLEVTENFQYRNRGLIHISDKAYNFFFSLEQQRVLLLNDAKLKKCSNSMVDKAHVPLLSDKVLKEEWAKCFRPDVVTSEHVSTCIEN